MRRYAFLLILALCLPGLAHGSGIWGGHDDPPTYVADSGAIAVTANNTYITCTSACTITPKAPAPGVQLCVDNAPGSATVITLTSLGVGKYYSLTDNSAWATANQKLVGAADVASSICIVGYDSTHYKIKSFNKAFTDTP